MPFRRARALAAVLTAGTLSVGIGSTVAAAGTPAKTKTVVEYHDTTPGQRVGRTPAVPTATAAPSTGLTQSVHLEIVGGELTVSPSIVTVTLTRDATGALTGVLPAIEVVDARGSFEGWRVRVRLADVTATDAQDKAVRIPPGKVEVAASGVDAVAGSADGVSLGRPGRGKGQTLLLEAARGHGAGTFVGSGVVTIDDRWATSAVVQLTVEVR